MKRIAIIIIGGLVSSWAVAQTGGLNQEIITIGDRSIQLRDAFKISDYPTIHDTVQNAPNVKFMPLSFDPKIKYEVPPIKAARLRIVEPLSKLNRFYLKGGVGSFVSPLAEVSYNSLRSRDKSFGFNGRFHSSKGGVQNVSSSAFSDIDLRPWMRFIGKHTRFDVEPIYQRNVLHRYGYLGNELDSTLSADATFQSFESYGGRLRLKSFHKDSTKINYDLALEGRMLQEYYHASEWNAKVQSTISSLYGKEYYRLDVGVDVNGYRGVDAFGVQEPGQNNTIVQFLPSVQTNTDRFNFRVGLALYSDISTKSRFFFFPDVAFSLNVLDGLMLPYARVSGDVKRVNFYGLSRLNPFVASGLDLKNERNTLNAELGLRGSLSQRLGYHIGGFFAKTDQQALFVGDTITGIRNTFHVVYDDVERIGALVELSYRVGEKVNVLAGFKYTGYTPEKEAMVWNMAELKGDLDLFYDIQDKFTVKLGLDFVGERFAKVLTSDVPLGYEVKSLDAFVDANLGLEYRYTRKISAFLDLNNLAGQRYFLYDNYPLMGFNVMGGFTLSIF